MLSNVVSRWDETLTLSVRITAEKEEQKELYTSNSATSSLRICWVSNFASYVPNELFHAVLVSANCGMWKDAVQKVLSVQWAWEIYSYWQTNK